ncbi:hypothetical protein Tco_1233249, partial [Tanacetum coccineum]
MSQATDVVSKLQKQGILLSKRFQLAILQILGERLILARCFTSDKLNALFQADGVEQLNKICSDVLAELKGDKEQVKVLKEGQNVDLKSKDNVSDSCEQSVEIDRLKQTLSEHVKVNESLMRTITLLKNDFKKEESRNIDREIALEKKIKQLDNIVFKRDQLAQTLEPKLYDGNVIKNTSVIVIPDSEETLMLAEEIHLKMLLKQQDPMMLVKKVNTTPVDYAALNQLYEDFEKQFVPQTELSTKQAFWSQNSMNSLDPSPSCRPTKVEVPKELPKVSMVNTTLKDLFNTFDPYLIDELFEVQNVFHQMEQVVEQYRLESKMIEVEMNQVLNENERLLEQVINKDIVNIIVNYSVDNAYVNVHKCEKCLKLETELLNKKDFIEKETYDKLFRSFTTLEKYCISLEVDTQLKQEIFQRDNSVTNQSAPSFDQYFKLNKLKTQSQEKDTIIKKVSKLIAENEHLKQTYKQLYDSIKPTRDALIAQINAKSLENLDLNAQLQEKVFAITALKKELRKLKGKSVIACRESVNKSKVIAPVVHKVDLEPLSPKLKYNRESHVDYIRITKENANTLHDIVEQARTLNPLDNTLAYACIHDLYIVQYLSKVNDRTRAKAVKSIKMKEWKST